VFADSREISAWAGGTTRDNVEQLPALLAVAYLRTARCVLWGLAGAGLLGAVVVALGLGWCCGLEQLEILT